MNINWYPGHMVKAENDIKKDLKIIDIVVEVLDARIPKSSKNPNIDKFSDGKLKIIILNKYDLADKENVKKWTNSYNELGIPVICMDSSNNQDIKSLVQKINELGKKFYDNKYKDRKININPIYKVLIVGIPNVGKSTIINKIAGRNSANMGNKPGVTKQKQWIKVGSNVELLDTPGLLWPKLDTKQIGVNLALTGNINQDILDSEELSIEGIKLLINNQNYKNMLFERYKLSDKDIIKVEDEPIEYSILKAIGKKRGCILPGGIVDTLKSAKAFLDDFKNGKIGKISLE